MIQFYVFDEINSYIPDTSLFIYKTSSKKECTEKLFICLKERSFYFFKAEHRKKELLN